MINPKAAVGNGSLSPLPDDDCREQPLRHRRRQRCVSRTGTQGYGRRTAHLRHRLLAEPGQRGGIQPAVRVVSAPAALSLRRGRGGISRGRGLRPLDAAVGRRWPDTEPAAVQSAACRGPGRAGTAPARVNAKGTPQWGVLFSF